MTGTATADPEEHPLLPGASPATIRSFLLPEDRRRVALVEADPARFGRAVRRAAEIATGEPVPADEPLKVTRGRAGL